MKKMKKVTAAVSALALAISLNTVYPAVTHAAIPSSPANSTIFGPNVYVFDPSMSKPDIESVTSAVYGNQERNEFGDERYALLFKPGAYNVNMNVGFNTSVAGLGQNPDDVTITGPLNVDAKWDNGNATRNFWRSIENVKIAPADPNATVRYAVSQAAPMRRVHVVSKDMHLFDFTASWDAGWASGGYLADSKIDANIIPASQQQWFSRNSEWNSWSNGVWNMVFVGDKNAPSGDFPDPPYTVIDKTPVVKEKPYLYVDNQGHYQVFVPSLETNTQGVSWANGQTPGQSISIDDFYIAKPDSATSAAINAALEDGKNLFFTPGIYHLSDTIHVTNPNTVVYGIGLPTLIPDNGQDVIVIDDVDGVNVSGLVIEAGEQTSSTLLKVGEPGSAADHSANPILLSDVFFRTGGHVNGSNDTALEINSNDVIGDHFWIWRADHGAGAAWTSNVSKNGLVVNGDDVTIYGLFNEHHNEYQTVWNGNGGRLYFYQSEIPYDVPDQQSWMSHNGTVNGYASYKIGDQVTSHEAWGLGIYSYFRDAAVKLENAIEAPANPGIKLHNLTTIWLNGTAGSEITHIVNGNGGSVTSSSNMRQTMKLFVGGDAEAPTAPTGLIATPVSSSQINLSWTASTDNVGVEGYEIYRNNTLIGSTIATAYNSTGLKASTGYTYKIVAKDGSGNRSAASSPATAVTPEISGGALDRTGWTAESSPSSGDAPANMFDGAGTRWSAGVPMANGQYIIVDMKTAADITKIVTESSGSDYAKSYEVYVSADGTNWGSNAASGNGASGATTINVTAAGVRYIKLVQTGTSGSWWSINEFNVYGVYQNTQVDTTAPDTAIVSSPAAVSGDSTPSFTFGSNEDGSTFECSLDNNGEYYAACTSPVTFSKLADGSHTLYVRAVDIFGNTDETPVPYTWVIDTVKPVITINGDPVIQLEKGTAYTDPGAAATDNHDGDLTGQITVTGTVDPTTAGDYTVQYNVSDAAGNAAVTVTRTVRVLEPVVSEGPSATITGAPNALSNSSSASFSFISNEENATFEYSLDDSDWTASASPLVLSELADGPHTLQVHAGNGQVTGEAASYTWTIDTVKPVITINGDAEIQITRGTAYQDQGATATDSRQGNLNNVVTTGDVVDVNTVGVYTIHYNATDDAGNAADEVSRTVRVVAPPPVISGPSLSSDANLKAISLSAKGQAIRLSPAFSQSTTDYTADTEADQVEISATVSDSKSRIGLKVNGQVPASQSSVHLTLGANVLEWTVAAENGNTKTYKVTVTRIAVPAPVFKDLQGHWAEELIKQAAEKKIVNGYADGTFRPDNTVTRAEFVVMLVKALQLPVSSKEVAFTDGATIQEWAEDSIAIAVNAGMINGYADGTFRPDAAITRAEMAVIIARILQLPAASAGTTGFSDDEAIPAWSKQAIEALKQAGILNGRGDNLFVPNGTATRAEAVVLLLRLLEQ
ncbi:immunoglobulin-like domain-containing protein [Paenibacillus glycanilyticus]|uniref:immunoglobulin-like domain-containing protein n=1 Tax=Paenibacillus glycanilyticus TaxID=126569 RepID=UPI000FD84B38|nr:immunoglobulin-like domain-containing protein [Paenibacillus glycanilyticus]